MNLPSRFLKRLQERVLEKLTLVSRRASSIAAICRRATMSWFPVIKIVQEVDGIPWKRHGLFPAYWPLLERIDGKRSVRDIVDELAYLPGYMQHGTLGERNKMG